MDAFLNLSLVIILPKVMRGPKCAGLGLCTLTAFGIILLGKVITIILGAVWITGKDGSKCGDLVPKFYTKSRIYFIASTIVIGLEITFGTMYLLKCGLQDAVRESVDQIEQEALMREAAEERRRG